MKKKKIENKLIDLYGISKAEAKHFWFAKLYVEVLVDKINKGTRLRDKLLEVDMKDRDSARVKRVVDAIAHNRMLLQEVS